MKKLLLFLLLLTPSFLLLEAQVGINTVDPDPSAYLDIYGVSGGLLPPRLTTDQRDQNLKTPAEGLVIYNLDTKSLQQNTANKSDAVYPNWVNVGAAPKWFYMPPSPLEVTDAIPYSKDLYAAYKQNIDISVIGNSDGGVSSDLQPYDVSKLEFIVLNYDHKVFTNVKVSDAGILTYTAVPSNLSDTTYMNIIFRVK